MTVGLKRLNQIIEAYGADPARWPDAERAGAEALLETSPEARRLADDAADLDAWLESAWAPGPSELTTARVLRAAPRRGPNRLRVASGVGWAAAAAAGLVLGLSLGGQVTRVWQADNALEQASTWSAYEGEYFG